MANYIGPENPNYEFAAQLYFSSYYDNHPTPPHLSYLGEFPLVFIENFRDHVAVTNSPRERKGFLQVIESAHIIHQASKSERDGPSGMQSIMRKAFELINDARSSAALIDIYHAGHNVNESLFLLSYLGHLSQFEGMEAAPAEHANKRKWVERFCGDETFLAQLNAYLETPLVARNLDEVVGFEELNQLDPASPIFAWELGDDFWRLRVKNGLVEGYGVTDLLNIDPAEFDMLNLLFSPAQYFGNLESWRLLTRAVDMAVPDHGVRSFSNNRSQDPAARYFDTEVEGLIPEKMLEAIRVDIVEVTGVKLMRVMAEQSQITDTGERLKGVEVLVPFTESNYNQLFQKA